MTKAFSLSFAAAAFCFLAIRLAGILLGPEYHAWPEELVRGTLGHELLRGLHRPFWDYQADYYDGGSLVSGFLAFIFFKIMGPSWLALKLSALVIPLATLFLLMFFLNRFFSRAAALCGGLLFAFAPPAYERLSTLAIGAPFEALFFVLVIFCLLYEILEREEDNGSLFTALGLAGGLAFWFTASTLAAFLTASLCLGFSGRLAPRAFMRLAAGFTLGILPFLAYNNAHGWRGWQFLLALFSSPFEYGETLLKKTVRFFAYDFPQAFGFPGGKPSNYGYYFLAAVMAASGSFAGAGKNGSRRAPIMVFAALFSIFYLVGHFDLSFGRDFFLSRYFSCLYLALVLFCAAGAGKSVRGVFLASFACMLAASVMGSVPFWRGAYGRPAAWKGYSYADLGGVWAEKPFAMPRGLGRLVKTLKGYEQDTSRKIAYGYFFSADFREKPARAARIGALIDANPELKPYILGWWGASFSARGERNAEAEAAMAEYAGFEDFFYWKYHSGLRFARPEDVKAAELPPASERWFYFYAGVSSSDWKEGDMSRIPDFTPLRQRWFFRGLGSELASRSLRRFFADSHASGVLFPACSGFTAASNYEAVRECEENTGWGAGWSLRMAFIEDTERFRDHISALPLNLHEAAKRGGEDFDRFFFGGTGSKSAGFAGEAF